MKTEASGGKVDRRTFLGTAVTAAGIAALRVQLSNANQDPAPKPTDGKKHTFGWRGEDFLLDGEPFQILSGEIHYARVPSPYWRDRLLKLKAMGLNTVSTYTFWNFHEPRPGIFNFTGMHDVAEFVRTAQQEGL